MEERITGLTPQEVALRQERGQVNISVDVQTKSVRRILLENILSLFNIVNFLLAAAVLAVGSYKNMLFMGVILCNTLIGIVQEIRSKRAVDKLSIVVSQKAAAIRDGEEIELPIEELVLDDVIRLRRGNQIPADSVVMSGSCLVNESLLTGESDLIQKQPGDTLLSGSFLVSGDCLCRVFHVGRDNYAATIHSSAKRAKKVRSEIMTTFNTIIKWISFIIFPLGAILFYSHYTADGATLTEAVVSTVGALVGMIPEGLILLTSTVLAVSVIRLSKYKVLVQQLYCIETLARVDVLCLDKTGTLTCDEMEVERILPLQGLDPVWLEGVLSSLAHGSRDDNATARALRARFDSTPCRQMTHTVDFSSEKKWSGGTLEGGESYALGAGEFLLGERYAAVAREAEPFAGPLRVLTLVRVPDGFSAQDEIQGTPEPLCLILIRDKLRAEARDTIRYFIEQGVALKVISGDAVTTVAHIAAQAGIPRADRAVDMTTLTTDDEVKAAAETYTVFGRVTPHQKQQLIQAMKAAGHTVAMTGDGVNDVLALREADCSVAMAAGSDAARNIAQLVLINNDFSAMPRVVAEGRRSINNIQRSSSLFLVKTVFSILLGVLTVCLHMRYPFQPIQMTLVGACTIGLPSFVLALEPNHDRVRGNFLFNILSRAIPGAVTIVCNIGLLYICQRLFALSDEQVSSMAVVLTALTGILLLIRISLPFTPIRAALLAVVCGSMLVGLTVFRELFEITPFTPLMLGTLLVLGIVCAVLFSGLYLISEFIREKKLGNAESLREHVSARIKRK